MFTWVKRVFWGAVFVGFFASLVIPRVALAASYGSGNYNSCAYGCAKAANGSTKQPQTTITLSSGLVVTINLQNGQKIPPNGYTVIIQPSGGQNGSLQKADFYVNGSLEYSGVPNSVGAIRWLWQPSQTSGTVTIKIVVTASDGSTSTQEFTVTIGTPDATPAATQEPTDPVSTVSRAIIGYVGTLPTPVLYAVPYLLFGLLVVNIVLLLTQTQREIREVTWLQRIINRERQTGFEKSTFVSLASHYLRTPISIIQGGFDLMQKQSPLPPNTAQRIQQLIEGLRLKVNSLLAQTEVINESATFSTPATLPSAWKSPGLYLPILLIGLFVLLFNYVAAHVETFSGGQLNLILQIVAYTLLATVSYQVFRRQQLKRRDTIAMQQVLAHEQTINQARDQFIAQSTATLGDDIKMLRDIMTQLPASEAAQFTKEGIQRFFAVLVKFTIASQLKGGQSHSPATPTSLGTMLGTIPQSLKTKASQKGVQLTTTADASFTTQNPQLVGYVLASLIDNAIDYSPAQQTIDVHASAAPGGVVISVTDHGAGVNAEKMSLLFRPFSQTQDVERFTHEGMGFSLYLDKLIMTYLGGNIAIQSKPGIETTATITLPAIA